MRGFRTWRAVAACLAVGVSALAGVSTVDARSDAVPSAARVARVVDGDTIVVVGGRRIRLVQIDSPEVGTGECYSRAAAKALRKLIPDGTAVTLESDPALDQVDRYGRLLRYVRRGKLNVNLELVKRGAAAPWFYDGARGRYAAALMRAATDAKAARVGLWGACPSTVLDPTRAIDTGPGSTPASPAAPVAPLLPPAPPPPASGSGCDPSYVGVCIPPPPPDLDCKDVAAKNFTVRWDVPSPDPHRFDGDRDGVGCES